MAPLLSNCPCRFRDFLISTPRILLFTSFPPYLCSFAFHLIPISLLAKKVTKLIRHFPNPRQWLGPHKACKRIVIRRRVVMYEMS